MAKAKKAPEAKPAPDGAKSAQAAADAQAAKQAKTVAKYAPSAKYQIAMGKATPSIRSGMLGAGDRVGADMLSGGEDALKFLVEKGVAVPAE